MNTMALLGILLIAYAVLVVWIAFAKPPKLWDMAKIKLFRKILGENGTVIFFIVFAIASAGLGIYLMVK